VPVSRMMLGTTPDDRPKINPKVERPSPKIVTSQPVTNAQSTPSMSRPLVFLALLATLDQHRRSPHHCCHDVLDTAARGRYSVRD
jgi:hypothetical protein